MKEEISLREVIKKDWEEPKLNDKRVKFFLELFLLIISGVSIFLFISVSLWFFMVLLMCC